MTGSSPMGWLETTIWIHPLPVRKDGEQTEIISSILGEYQHRFSEYQKVKSQSDLLGLAFPPIPASVELSLEL